MTKLSAIAFALLASVALATGPASAKHGTHPEVGDDRGTHVEVGDDHGSHATEVEVHKNKGKTKATKPGKVDDDLIKGHKGGKSK